MFNHADHALFPQVDGLWLSVLSWSRSRHFGKCCFWKLDQYQQGNPHPADGRHLGSGGLLLTETSGIQGQDLVINFTVSSVCLLFDLNIVINHEDCVGRRILCVRDI